MGTTRIIGAAAVLLHMATTSAQTPYPELTIQDVTWMEGTHHYAVTNKILSPATPELPIEVGASANVEFVSATEVRLLPGFHAGGFNSQGQFHARIDQGLGDPADLVIISPAPDGSSPYGSIEDNVVHVHKWEKVEVGLRLPQIYQAAVDSFFAHYYSTADPYVATSWNIDHVHDLNPYADDSLQLVMILTKPNGSQALQWGYFMREARWVNNSTLSRLAEDVSDPLYPYHVRFRFAPDIEGTWSFSISIKAPYSQSNSGQLFPEHSIFGFNFYCRPALDNNNGLLHVNTENHRILQFDTGNPFFAIGPNLGIEPIGSGWQSPSTYSIRRGSYTNLLSAMNNLSYAGGNFMRTFLGDKTIGFENVNLGVYDNFVDSLGCAVPNNAIIQANGQHQAWVFDQLLDTARALGIYIQLCATPYPPIIDYETFAWHNDAYKKNFVDPTRNPTTGMFSMRHYFYRNGDPDDPLNATEGPFYFWKRRYKYLMSRWGYSVNLPIIEHFNEVDQMLTYSYRDLRPDGNPATMDPAICVENQIEWTPDDSLPAVLRQWATDIGAYVRDDQVLSNTTNSALGVKKLFSFSYAGNSPEAISHYLPSTTSYIDLFDVHMGLHPDLMSLDPALNDRYNLDRRIFNGFNNANQLWDNLPNLSANISERKPFNHGEFNHYTKFIIPSVIPGQSSIWSNDIEKIFHNYDVSFHNELWSSVFSGKYATGTTWHTKRLVWFPGTLPYPPNDPANLFQHSDFQQFSNIAGDTNGIWVNNSIKLIRNNRLYHHFRPLSDFVNLPSVMNLGILTEHFSPRMFFDNDASNGTDELEAYYLISDYSSAIGWVHNRNASVAKSFYVRSGTLEHNFLGCTTPSSSSITLSGFFSLHEHYITWFPTRTGLLALPPDTVLVTNENGELLIDLTGYFNAISDNYLDTLHSDYAFVITPHPFVKSLDYTLDESFSETTWDFALFPNPSASFLSLTFDDDVSKDVFILDASGRNVIGYSNVRSEQVQISTEHLARGAYWVRVIAGTKTKTKKLIIH
ncbi:MAG: T9SS type A sorting domain-containing protein [Flavobacteriales bacterium]|jgi:hypothetical protein